MPTTQHATLMRAYGGSLGVCGGFVGDYHPQNVGEVSPPNAGEVSPQNVGEVSPQNVGGNYPPAQKTKRHNLPTEPINTNPSANQWSAECSWRRWVPSLFSRFLSANAIEGFIVAETCSQL